MRAKQLAGNASGTATRPPCARRAVGGSRHARLIRWATRQHRLRRILLTAADRLNLKATAHAPLPTLQNFIPVNSAPNAPAAP